VIAQRAARGLDERGLIAGAQLARRAPLLATGARSAVEHTEALLLKAVERCGDEHLGLKAARAIQVGDFEVL
jgi:Arabinose-binding domain of AraC transcription regulator, N-term